MKADEIQHREDAISQRLRYRGDVERQKVCVIGAGMSGLITIKELLDENQHVVCYEQQSAAGGVFNLRDRFSNTAYDSLLLTVSNYAMAFSCFPPADHEERRFWTVREYQRYLRRFADHFHLRDCIQFEHEVVRIERWKSRLWLVTVRHAGKERREVFDAIAVCSGAFQQPKYPHLPFAPGSADRPEVLHAIEYERSDRFLGKNVLCVGMGESGADIAHEIAMVAEDAVLSVRPSPAPLIPRYDCEHIGPIPNDGETTRHRYRVFLNQFRSRFNKTRDDASARNPAADLASRASHVSAASLGDAAPGSDSERYERIARFIADWNRRSFAGGLAFVSRYLNKNTIFVKDVVDGRLSVNFSGLARIEGKHCRFQDGTTFRADAIVCCTGYETVQHPLFQSDPALREHLGGRIDPRALFKHSLHPRLGKSLALIGYARPTQGMLPACAELQARYFALLCSNRRALPADLERRTRAEARAEELMLQGDSNITTLVQYPYWSEELAGLIGCKPSLWTRLRDPMLAYKLFFGSMVSNRYRLDGPHRDPAAAKRVIKRLPVADTLGGQLTLALLSSRTVYEAAAAVTLLSDMIAARTANSAGGRDPAFHAWGPRQLQPRAQRPDMRDWLS